MSSDNAEISAIAFNEHTAIGDKRLHTGFGHQAVQFLLSKAGSNGGSVQALLEHKDPLRIIADLVPRDLAAKYSMAHVSKKEEDFDVNLAEEHGVLETKLEKEEETFITHNSSEGGVVVDSFVKVEALNNKPALETRDHSGIVGLVLQFVKPP